MTTFNQIDVGQSHPWQNPATGQLMGQVVVEGSRTIFYPRGRSRFSQDVTFWAVAWNGLGGGAANSVAALKYMLAQLEELAGNRELQPVYIQWTQTAQGGATLAAAELHDGWYIISDFQADYQSFVPSGIAKCHLVVERVAPPPPTRVAYGYALAALSTNFVGSSLLVTTVIAFPVGTSFPADTFTRTGGEGAMSLISQPVTNPLLFQLSATVTNWWKGSCHVYDTINTGSNPVPLAGLFVNANWVEVFSPERYYQGDAFVTNGFLGLLFQAGTTNLVTVYLWSTVTSAWISMGTLQVFGDGGGANTNVGYSFDRVGPEEIGVTVSTVGTANVGPPSTSQWGFRLQRGAYGARIAWTSLAQNYLLAGIGALVPGLHFVPSASTPIYVANPGAITQMTLDGTVSLAPSTAYGYAVVLAPAAGQQYLTGFLYQNQSGQAQPYVTTGFVSLGDGPGVNATKYFGFFAIPYVTTVNLQANAATGTLGTGWSSVVDANANSGNAAKAASGTVSTNADLFGTAWQPAAGSYDVWFRVRVTSAAGSAAEMTLGLWDTVAAAFVSPGSTTFRANQAATGYTWLKANSALVTAPAGHNVQFRAVTAATLGTDWFIDEAVLVPGIAAGSVAPNFPIDLFNQFLGDFSNRLVRL